MKFLKTLLFLLAGLIAGVAGATEVVRVGGVGSLTPLMRLLIADYVRNNPAVEVQLIHPPVGSSGGMRALAAGKLDVALLGREAKPEEKGVGQTWLKTPLLLATSGGKARRLSRNDLADIFSGKRTTWDDGKPIRLVLRGQHESETTMLRKLSPAVDTAVTAAIARNAGPIAENDLEAMQMISSIAGSLGSTTLGLMLTESRAIDILAIDGIRPDSKKLENQDYPWYRDYYLFLNDQPSATVRSFVSYLNSPAALSIARKYAYLPLATK